jgi:hypothetical protein
MFKETNKEGKKLGEKQKPAVNSERWKLEMNLIRKRKTGWKCGGKS